MNPLFLVGKNHHAWCLLHPRESSPLCAVLRLSFHSKYNKPVVKANLFTKLFCHSSVNCQTKPRYTCSMHDVQLSTPTRAGTRCIHICVEVGQSTHISLYVDLVAGENDHNLVWPFQGCVTIQLLNQEVNYNHHTTSIEFRGSESKEHNKRPQKHVDGVGWGCREFITHEVLQGTCRNPQYLKDDCLYFRIDQVNIYNDNRPWLTPTL